jgi:LEA14-like dessication related protein
VNIKMKRSLATLVLSAVLLSTASLPAWAADGQNLAALAAASTNVNYTLSNKIEVEIKSILNEHESDSTKLGTVIRIRNTSDKITRVPDFELRVLMADGIEYALQPSAKNPKSIQPKSQLELSYLSIVERSDDVDLTSLNFIDVDMDVYPKVETTLLTIPVDAGIVWNGSDSTITKSSAILKWGEAFTLPSSRSPLGFIPVDIHKDITVKGVSTVVQMQVVNATKERQTVPNFGIDGKSESKVYSGSRAEAAVTLDPGEKRYIHIVIPTDLDTEFTSLNVVTPESFAASLGEGKFYEDIYQVGRVNILLPTGAVTQGVIPAPEYTLGTPVRLDATNKFVPSNVDLSLVELHVTSNEDDGFNTAVAKFKLTNNSDRPIPIPAIQTELVSIDGYAYGGRRQEATALSVVPNASYVVSYSYALPASETGESLKMNLYSQQTNGDISYKSLLASAKVPVQKNDLTSKILNVYPYEITIKDWSISAIFQANMSYDYKLKLDLSMKPDKQVTVDKFNSKLSFELFDNVGNPVGKSVQALSGEGRLYNGTNTIDLNARSNQLDFPIQVKVFETFTNEYGESVKRLLTTFKQ